MSLAPIALFCFKRLDHLRLTVEALKKNPESHLSPLIIYSDGPKKPEEVEFVHSVRDYLKTIDGFASIEIKERPINLGLAKSIINGVSEVISKYHKVIVLEDDIVVSEYFLRFMNDFLNIYENDHRVISANAVTTKFSKPMKSPFFLKGADCWGWATWKRGWDLFEPNGEKLLRLLSYHNLCHSFDYDATYPFVQMLKDQISKKNDSWAIRWQASAFILGKLTLYPHVSLAKNIGFDGSGEHCSTSDAYLVTLSRVPINVHCDKVEESLHAREQMKSFFRIYTASEKTTDINSKLKKIFRFFLRVLNLKIK